MKTILTMLVVLLPLVAFGHGSVIELTNLSASGALEKFQAEESEETLDAFNGIKAWPSADMIKVKVYLKETDTLVYSCKMEHSDEGEILVCQKDS